MKPYNIKTSIDGNDIKNTHIADVVLSSRNPIMIKSDRMKPIVRIGVSDIGYFVSSPQRFKAEKRIETINALNLNQTLELSSEKHSSIRLRTAINTPSLDSAIGSGEIVYLVLDEITSDNIGYMLPSGSYNKNSFGLRGDVDSLSGNDWAVFNGVNLYFNLDNLRSIASNVTGSEEFFVSVNDVNGGYLYIGVSEGDVSCEIVLSGQSTSEQYKWNGLDWAYSINWDEQESGIPIEVINNNMNVVFSFSDIDYSSCDARYINSSGIQTDMNKTIISSYPFDCRNMTSGLGLYNVFYKIDGEWIFQPDRHISPPINT